MVLTVGLSLSFLIYFGYGLNQLCFLAGQELRSQGKIPSSRIQPGSFLAGEEVTGYLYLSYYDVDVRKRIEHNMLEYRNSLTAKSQLCACNGAEIWW